MRLLHKCTWSAEPQVWVREAARFRAAEWRLESGLQLGKVALVAHMDRKGRGAPWPGLLPWERPWADAAGERCRKLAGQLFVIVCISRGRRWRRAREEDLRISLGDTLSRTPVTAACEKRKVTTVFALSSLRPRHCPRGGMPRVGAHVCGALACDFSRGS